MFEGVNQAAKGEFNGWRLMVAGAQGAATGAAAAAAGGTSLWVQSGAGAAASVAVGAGGRAARGEEQSLEASTVDAALGGLLGPAAEKIGGALKRGLLQRSLGRGKVPNWEGAAKDIARIAKSLDETGKLPPGYSRNGFLQGGKKYKDNAKDLPKPVGIWREADVGDIRVGDGGARGSQRALFDEAGNIWYSPDHYETFIPIRVGRSQ